MIKGTGIFIDCPISNGHNTCATGSKFLMKLNKPFIRHTALGEAFIAGSSPEEAANAGEAAGKETQAALDDGRLDERRFASYKKLKGQ